MMLSMYNTMQEYEVVGVVFDNAWLIKNKDKLESAMYDDMRQNDILPILDKKGKMSCSYNIDENIFDFVMTGWGCKIDDIDPTKYSGVFMSGILLDLENKELLLCDAA